MRLRSISLVYSRRSLFSPFVPSLSLSFSSGVLRRSIAPRALPDALSYLPAPGALSVSQQPEESLLPDALRSHYFDRPGRGRDSFPRRTSSGGWSRWRRPSDGASNSFHEQHALPLRFIPFSRSLRPRAAASAKESTRGILVVIAPRTWCDDVRETNLHCKPSEFGLSSQRAGIALLAFTDSAFSLLVINSRLIGGIKFWETDA